MRLVHVDYTIYSPSYRATRDSEGNPQDGHGECWDCPTIRSAKRKAKDLGIGSTIVRNFNQAYRPDGGGEWWQADFCWVWNGLSFVKVHSVSETKWVIPDHPWFEHASLRRLRSVKS